MQNIVQLFFILFLLSACGFIENKNEGNSAELADRYFEGEITLTESRGVYGRLFQLQAIYTISEQKLKREEHFRIAAQSLRDYAGVIIDLQKDSVECYLVKELEKVYVKHTLSIKEYQAFIAADRFPLSIPSPIDQTFKVLNENHLINQVKDSTQIKGFNADYSLFQDDLKEFKQEIFDTKEIKVKRPMLEMAFMGLPEEVNFPLVSLLRTIISDLSNDSIMNGLIARDLYQLSRKISGNPAVNEDSSLAELAKNKWINRGIKLLKKGVDLHFYTTVELDNASRQTIPDSKFSVPNKPFIETADFEEFLSFLPLPSNDNFELDD